MSNYYPGPLTISDIEVAQVQEAAEKLGIDVLNTRVQKTGDEQYKLLVASSTKQSNVVHQSGVANIVVEYGDFAKDLKRASDALREVCLRFVLLS